MRIAVAEIVQETGSFSPMVAEIQDFESYGLFFGQDVLDRLPGVGPIGGMLEVAGEQKISAEYLPIIRAWGGAGGIITAEVFELFRNRLIAGLQAVLPVDGIFLSLHGAAASVVDDDVEGNLLQAIREIVGPDLPIAVCLDHHANITQRMFEHGTVLVGHETQPHDPKATGRKTAEIFFKILKQQIRPTKAWRKIPMITPQDQFLTSQGPMKAWFDQAREMEKRPGVIDVSPYPMQPWLDVLEGGWAVVVHTDNDQPLAEQLAQASADLAWSLREEFWRSERLPADEAVRRAVQAEKGLIILSDTGDSVYGGGPGDSTCILRPLIEQSIPCLAYVPIIDPPAVAVALAAGVGSDITLTLGGKVDLIFNPPLEVTCRVVAVSQGVTVHLPERGVCDIGRAALLEVGQVRIVVIELRTFAINHPILYTHLGLKIEDAKMVVVKTASNFQFFAAWRAGLIRVDSPGTTQSDLTAFEWKRIPHPMYPFDSFPEDAKPTKQAPVEPITPGRSLGDTYQQAQSRTLE